ncbi:MAG: hypothetical protein SFV23_15480 [Planctomycetaceae bacterium]|nr:hypothetical protein [Planctomycetaceae bacterium]
MSSQKTPLWQQMLAKRREWIESQPTLSGQLASMVREAAKDIRGTLHETFFGRPEHVPEAGAPGNPTQLMINDDLGQGNEKDGFSRSRASPANAELQKHVTLDPQGSQQRGMEMSGLHGPPGDQPASYQSELQRYVSHAQESQHEQEVER